MLRHAPFKNSLGDVYALSWHSPRHDRHRGVDEANTGPEITTSQNFLLEGPEEENMLTGKIEDGSSEFWIRVAERVRSSLSKPSSWKINHATGWYIVRRVTIGVVPRVIALF